MITQVAHCLLSLMYLVKNINLVNFIQQTLPFVFSGAECWIYSPLCLVFGRSVGYILPFVFFQGRSVSYISLRYYYIKVKFYVRINLHPTNNFFWCGGECPISLPRKKIYCCLEWFALKCGSLVFYETVQPAFIEN